MPLKKNIHIINIFRHKATFQTILVISLTRKKSCVYREQVSEAQNCKALM